MYCKLITKNDCAVKAVLSCTPVEFLIINKAIARCSNDEFYTESDRRTMVLMGEAMKNFEQVEVADTPQTDKILEHNKTLCNFINAIPSADRPQGEWVEHWYPHFDVAGIECSICSKDVPYWERNYDMPRYCPYCGARMKGADDEIQP